MTEIIKETITTQEGSVQESNVQGGIVEPVVVNSPIRRGAAGLSPSVLYQQLIENPNISVILTGTRNHLNETIGYFSNN